MNIESTKNKVVSAEFEKLEAFKDIVREKVGDAETSDEIINDKKSMFEFDKKMFDVCVKNANDMFDNLILPLNKNNIEKAKKIAKEHFPSNQLNVIIKNKKFDDLSKYLETHYELTIMNNYLLHMDATRHDWLSDLYEKMDEIGRNTKNLKSFGNMFGRFWDLSIHDLYRLPIEQIKRFSSMLKQKDFLNRIADLLGRLASSQKEYEEYLVKEIKYSPSKKKTYKAPINTVGITMGDSIPLLLAYQFQLRKKDSTKAIFNKNLIEKKLLEFDRRDKMIDEVVTHRTERKFKEDSMGPFIIAVDTSGSMHGEPETIAKAFALALIKIANKDNRKCFVISFSTSTIEFDATDITNDWNKLFYFLSLSFSGGTDIGPAITKAIAKVKEEDYVNADVIFVSDMIINSLGSNLEKEVRELKEKKVRFHSLTIGNSFHKLNTEFLDNNWIYDGSRKSIDNIIKSLENMNTTDNKKASI